MAYSVRLQQLNIIEEVNVRRARKKTWGSGQGTEYEVLEHITLSPAGPYDFPMRHFETWLRAAELNKYYNLCIFVYPFPVVARDPVDRNLSASSCRLLRFFAQNHGSEADSSFNKFGAPDSGAATPNPDVTLDLSSPLLC
jgi:hypothetical protein